MAKEHLAPSAWNAVLPDLDDDPDLVIFDFDGVIADSEVISLSSLRHTFESFGITISLNEVRDRFLGVSLAKIAQTMNDLGRPEDTERFKRAWEENLFERFRKELEPVIGIEPLLDRLDARNIRFCIASSGTFQRIGVALDAIGLASKFKHVFSAEQVEKGKPAPDLFLHAAALMGATPERCVVVEDSLFGIQAAKSAGMTCIGFLGGAHLADCRAEHRRQLLAAGEDGTVTQHSDIMAGTPD